jgi:hypothetical protein
MGFVTPKAAVSPIPSFPVQPKAPAVFRPDQLAGGMQLKVPAIRQGSKPLQKQPTATPRVYRPDFSLAQRKAPQVYQPQISAMQPKAPPVYRPGASVTQRKAPPVYRPRASVTQPKAPPVYRPNASTTQRKAPPAYQPSASAVTQLHSPAPYRPGPGPGAGKAPPVYRPNVSRGAQPKVLHVPGFATDPRTAIKIPPFPSHLTSKAAPTSLRASLRAAAPSRPSHGGTVQRATVTLKYTGESEESYADIVSDAKKFHASLGKGVLYDAENSEVLSTKSAVKDGHVDVFAHGNYQQVGDFSTGQLRAFLDENLGVLGIAALKSVKLHSCDSNATPDEDAEDTRPFAKKLFEEYLDDNQFVETEGFAGHAVTDSAGHSRVLKNPAQEEAYRRAMKPRVGVELDTSAVETQYLEGRGTGSGSYDYGDALEYLTGKVAIDLNELAGPNALRAALNERRDWINEETSSESIEIESIDTFHAYAGTGVRTL